jgi:hypothetical protein
MTAAALLARAVASGLTLTPNGDRLRWRGPKPTPELLRELAEHKAELLNLLSRGDPPQVGGSPVSHISITEESSFEAEQAYQRFPAHTAHLVGGWQYQILRSPPSWSDPTDEPQVGAVCSCCGSRRWWREIHKPSGWCCWTCHPPDHLPSKGVTEVRT